MGRHLEKEDVKFQLFNKKNELVCGPPQVTLTHRSVQVKVDDTTCNVCIKQVNAYSDGSLDTRRFFILPRPTPLNPICGGEFVGPVPEKSASLHVLNDPSLLIRILHNLNLGWSYKLVDY